MDNLDSTILNALQNDFPLAERPYEILAEELQIEQTELMERVRLLTSAGIIRRIGVSLDSRSLGYAGTLCALSVPPELIDRVAEYINAITQITHCYLRDHTFNIWFTIIARDTSQIDAILNRIRVDFRLDFSQVLNLPMKSPFKLDARFKPVL